MAIFNIEPKTSKVTGGVTIDVTGTNFVKTPFELAPLTTNVINTSTTQAALTDTVNGLVLSVSENTAQRASFEIDQDFPRAFNLCLDFNFLAQSIPLIHKSVLIGLELKDLSNPSKKIRYYISYDQFQGYQIVLEEKLGTSILYRKEEFIDPNAINKIGLEACGKYIHGFLNISGHKIYFLKTNELTSTDYRVEVFSESPSNGVAMNSQVIVSHLKAMDSTSFAGYPAEIINFTDTKVRFKTVAGEISMGDLIVASADLSYQINTDAVKYVYGAGIANVRKQFDTVQAIYSQYVTPSREELFNNQEGFQWDENYILSENSKNKELSVPSLWDPTTGNVPKDFFQSGVGTHSALSVVGIEKVIANDTEAWFPKINHGTYFIHNVPYYLFSDQSIIEYLNEFKTIDNRSKHNLLFRPKIGIPVSVYSMTEEVETKTTVQKRRLTKKGSFTGKVINGTELDTVNTENIDLTKEEFIVKVNSNNEIINWIIPIGDTLTTGIYKFYLPKVPLNEFNVIFSRKDIFQTEKTKANRYGDSIYSGFIYGEGVENFGDYSIDYQTGEVEVNLQYLYTELGVVSFVFDYPAVIEFNKDFTKDCGSYITDPTFSDLAILDNIGSSSGRSGQKFRLTDFPIIDRSSQAILDTHNFKLFVYDEFDNSFDKDWTRIKNLEECGPNDKCYELDYSTGIVKFGNNIHGKIPGKYLRILAGYKPTLQIQFEPETSNDYWIAKTTDLNLTKQNLSSGFLFLNRKNLVPSQISAEFSSSHITVFETTDLSATAYTQDGEIIPNMPINFEILNGGGSLRDEKLITNPNGYVSTIYTPSSRLEDQSIRIDLFTPGNDATTPGFQITQAYGSKGGVPFLSLKSNEPIQGDLADMIVFKILDDGDEFLPYNNLTRKGGRYVLLYNELPTPTPVRGNFLAGSIMGFLEQLPQPFDQYAPNYEPNLRGFYIVGKKIIQARAYVDLEDNRVYSNIVSVTCEYSPIQKGVWTLPTPPLDYESSQINTATYIDINV